MSKLNPKRYFRQNWSELNKELLEIIVSKLMNSKFPWQDIARFRSVCSSWKAAVQYPKLGPLLLLPSDQEDDSVNLELFSVRDKVTWDLNWNVLKSNDVIFIPQEIQIMGSSHGWLVLMDESKTPYLFNMFSKNRVELPGEGAIQQLVGYKFSSSSEPSHFRTLISKAILTGNPSCTRDYKVVIIHNSCRKLAFWGKGDDSWTGFSACQGYHDVVWSESDETLYATRDGPIIEGWKFSCAFPTGKVLMKYSLSNADLSIFSRDKCTTQWYLVPSKGDILFVLRYIGYIVRENGDLLCEGELDDDDLYNCCYRTIEFRVFKVDMAGRNLDELKSLQDEILFLGGNHSVSLPSVECQGFKSNSIYFTDDYWDGMFLDYFYGGHDFGVFSLEDGTVDNSICDSYLVNRFDPIPFWVITN